MHYQSAHPKQLLNSLPISQFTRVERICSDEDDKLQQLNKMYEKFRERGYPVEVLDHALTRIGTTRTKSSGPLDRPLFIHTFNRESDNIRQAIRKNLRILQADNSLAYELKTGPVIAHRRNKTLCDVLVQADPRHKYAKTIPKISQKTGCYKCHNWNVCNSLICGEHFTDPHRDNRYRIKEYLNCNTDYCFYILKCPCTFTYVGKTTGPFKRRFQKHRSDIRLALSKTGQADRS